ncbi:MAG: DUF427 domain-containing protein [Gammaproteobacteria bacterium]|nr:DUF427 domain-containing protein [Gammaproteobacteria bacterium]
MSIDWKYRGRARPAFAIEPGPGQESVWDYPRPPALVRDTRLVEVRLDGRELAASREAVRVLETASPPTFYLPPRHVDVTALARTAGATHCEWKGDATYWTSSTHPELGAVAWSYEDPTHAFASLRGYLSFYPAVAECYVAGERVRPQPGEYYGGWVTDEIVGPFKGEPGTRGW